VGTVENDENGGDWSPVITNITEVTTAAYTCAVVLKTPDGFLNLRQGPGAGFGIVTKLFQGDFLYVDTTKCQMIDDRQFCDERSQWTHVLSILRVDGSSDKAQTLAHGWASNQYVQRSRCPE